MYTVAGIFDSRADAERAAERLRSASIDEEHLALLTPDASGQKVEEEVLTIETKERHVGEKVGGAAGRAARHALDDGVLKARLHDEVHIFEEALRSGRTVVVALARDSERAGSARAEMKRAGALSLEEAD